MHNRMRTRPRYWKLVDRKVLPCRDIVEWGKCLEEKDRVIRQDTLDGQVLISTVFLGLDHNFCFSGPPILFETMIFGGKDDHYQERYHSIEEAEKRHKELLVMLRAGIDVESEELSDG